MPQGNQQPSNKTLQPTAYSLRFGRKLPPLRLSEAGELCVKPLNYARWLATRMSTMVDTRKAVYYS